MTDADRNAWDSMPREHAYDPVSHPELFEGVLWRRVVAFVIDLIVIGVPVLLGALFVLLFGFLTFGLGWVLFWLATPATVIWALLYYGLTIGGPRSATIGMSTVGLQLRTWYGAPGYFVLGAVHAVAYWMLISAFSPLILIVGLFNGRKRLVHDFILGTVVINAPERLRYPSAASRM